MALTAMLSQIPEKFRGVVAMLLTLAGVAEDNWAPDVDPSAGPLRQAGQVGTVISVVVIGVVALIGVLIFAQVSEALPTIDNTQLSDASTSVTDGFAGAMELVPIVLLVLIAALVIGVVQRMRMTA